MEWIAVPAVQWIAVPAVLWIAISVILRIAVPIRVVWVRCLPVLWLNGPPSCDPNVVEWMYDTFLIVFMHMLIFRLTDSIRMTNVEMRSACCVFLEGVVGMDN